MATHRIDLHDIELEPRLAPAAALVADINANFNGLGSAPSAMMALGSLAIFSANDSVRGRELWRTDGTSAGTFLLRDIRPGTSGSYPTLLGVAGTTLYFTANDGVSGTELWRTDGTTAGTALVRDIIPSFTKKKGTLYFSMAAAAAPPRLPLCHVPPGPPSEAFAITSSTAATTVRLSSTTPMTTTRSSI